MKILITGAAGLIGSHTFRLLNEKGFDVYGVYRNGQEKKERSIIADLADPADLKKISSLSPDVIVHCASALPGINGLDSEQAANMNMSMDQAMISYCSANGCKLIYTSGTSLYKVTGMNCSESSELDPASPYLKAKLRTEQQMIKDAPEYVILRISAPYGPGQKANTVLKKFITQALADHPIRYHGTGNRNQDFTHVSDVARAIQTSLSVKNSDVFNIASGNPVGMKDLAIMIKSIIPGCKSIIEPSGIEDPEENYRALYDISKAKTVLGWRPEVSLEKGILQVSEFLKQVH